MEDTIRIIIGLGLVLMIAYIVYLLIYQIKFANTPTWTGIIISALLGCLPFYLVLCYFGIMGEEDGEEDDDEE